MKKLLWVMALLSIWLVPEIALAYPIPPQPLRKLCQESDLIIVATVVSVTTTTDREGFGIAKAVLYPTTVLKGSLGQGAVEVLYSPDIICPAPPHYAEGEQVLAFLYSSKEEAGYYTAGLSWGAKNLPWPAIQSYADRVRELLEIERLDPTLQQAQLLEWLVRCTENPATRWEGAYELARDPQFLHYDEKIPPPNFASMLSAEQKNRLANALYGSLEIGPGEMSLIDLLERWENPYLMGFIFNHLKAIKDDPSSYEIGHLMTLVARAAGSEAGLKLAERFRDVYFMREENRGLQDRRAILAEFIAALEHNPQVAKLLSPPSQPKPKAEHQATVSTPKSLTQKKSSSGFSLFAAALAVAAAFASARAFFVR